MRSELLVSLKLEGQVVISLISGFWGLDDYRKRFSDLKQVLGVSDPGLSKALRRLMAEGIIERDDRGMYSVKPELRPRLGDLLQPLYNDYLLERCKVLARSLMKLNGVGSLIVFGSVSQGKARYDSDVDLMVVVDERDETLEGKIHGVVSDFVLKSGVPVEAIIVSEAGLRSIIEGEQKLLFGLLQGYTILYDRVNAANFLHKKELEVKGKYEYYEGVPLWLPRMK